MWHRKMTALWRLCCAICLTSCASQNPIISTNAPWHLPPVSYECAEWPNPPVGVAQQSDIALWLTDVYTAFTDCKQTLAIVQTANSDF